MLAEGSEKSVGQAGQPLRGSGVLSGRALDLRDQLAVTVARIVNRVAAVRLRPDLGQELEAASDRLGGLELIAEHRSQRQRDRGAPEHVEQRQVAAGDRLPQPLLAERPGAEALDVGHVRVQDDREFTRTARWHRRTLAVRWANRAARLWPRLKASTIVEVAVPRMAMRLAVLAAGMFGSPALLTARRRRSGPREKSRSLTTP